VGGQYEDTFKETERDIVDRLPLDQKVPSVSSCEHENAL
jgi:hypothetical protein